MLCYPCEMLEFSGRGQSPLGVGPRIDHALSQAATPWLHRHYPASTLLWMAPTSKHHCPCPRSYTCSRVPVSPGPTLGSPWLPRILDVRLDTASDPGEYRRRSPLRCAGCCLSAGQNRRHSPTKTFGAQHLQGRLHPLPLHLACFRAYTSTRPLPETPQGSILGSRLTITQAGFSPARTRGLARPHCPRYSFLLFPQSRLEKGSDPFLFPFGVFAEESVSFSGLTHGTVSRKFS